MTTNLNIKDANMDDASARFSLIEMDNTPTFVAKVEPVAPVVPDITGPEMYGSPGVSAEGKARALADEAASVAAGWSLEPPVYEIGRVVNSMGVGNYRASRSTHDDMLSLTEGANKLIDLVKAENRKDLVVQVPTLKMLPDGRITRGQAALEISERALTGVGTHITPGGAGYLKQCPPELRAINFNHWAANGFREDVRATMAAKEEWVNNGSKGREPGPIMKEKEVTLRTRQNHTTNRKEAFAVVGPRYGAHDIDKIAEQILTSPSIPGDAKCDIVYDGYRARIDVLFHSNVQPEKVVAGEIFKAGIMVKTADDGSGSIQISAQVWRNLCLNLIIIDHAKDLVTRRKHYGTGIQADVEAGILTAMGKVKHFADKWSEATLENVLEKYGVHDVEAVFRGLVFNKVVHVPGVKPEEMMERLNRAYQAEPGYGKTAIVNAVTRAAHAETWGSWTDVEDLERKGGELLFQPVWNIAIPADELAELSY
jgi:hypothetical protein